MFLRPTKKIAVDNYFGVTYRFTERTFNESVSWAIPYVSILFLLGNDLQ